MVDKEQFKKSLMDTTIDVHTKQKGRINSMLNPEFLECDANEMSVRIRFGVEEWQINRGGTLHGGILATMFDFSFGALTRAVVGLGFVPTVELNTTYVRPVNKNEHVIIEAKILKSGKKITHIFGEATVEETGKNAAFGKGIFFNEDTRGDNK